MGLPAVHTGQTSCLRKLHSEERNGHAHQQHKSLALPSIDTIPQRRTSPKPQQEHSASSILREQRQQSSPDTPDHASPPPPKKKSPWSLRSYPDMTFFRHDGATCRRVLTPPASPEDVVIAAAILAAPPDPADIDVALPAI